MASPKVIENARQIMALNPIFLDTETTGFNQDDVVIEIGVVDMHGGSLIESLVNPGMPIPKESSEIHNITDSMVENSPLWKDIWGDVEQILRGRVIGMYNAEFDLRLIKQTHSQHWIEGGINVNKTFCVMKQFAAFYGEWDTRKSGFRYHKLDNAGRMCNIALPNSHRAVDDARLTAELFAYIANFKPSK
ncbi:MAG: 3'-5' exonuclease [Anaerolineaceae bacterium]|nr:3'-5' exonuclease [Anaerolineaceae bacterium]